MANGTILKLPPKSSLVDKQFFQVPQADGLLAGFQYDAETCTLFAKESQVIVPGAHGLTHIAEDPIPDATPDNPGLLSADDKAKLDSLLQMRIGVLGFQGSGFPDDGGALVGDIILAAGSEFISLERLGNVIRFTVDSPLPLDCACFAPGAPVLMSDGTTKPIEQVQVDDLVITHEGRVRSVTKTFVRDYDDEILDVDVYGHNKQFLVTKGHPIYAYAEKVNARRTSLIRDKCGVILEPRGATWVLSHDLEKDDFLVKRFGHNKVIDTKEIHWGVGFSPDRPVLVEDGKVYPARYSKKGKLYIDGKAFGVPEKSELDNDLLDLFGYYLAEGCADSKNGIRFTVHKLEMQPGEIGSEIVRIIRNKFGIEPAIYPKSNSENSVDIQFYSRILVHKFRAWFGTHAPKKKVADWILHLPSEKQYRIVVAFVKGDGSKRFSGKGRIRIEISSRDLTNQLRFMAERAGLEFRGFKPRKTGRQSRIYDNIEFSATHNRQFFFDITGVMPDEPKIYNYLKTDGEILHKIRSVKKTPYTGKVYNLEVEDDHSYVVDGIVVHNCETCSQIFWIQDESEVSAVRPPSCNGKMPGVNAYGELKIYTFPETTILDPNDPLATLNQKGQFPALIFKRYDNAVTPFESEFELVLKRNENLTSQVGWAFTPGFLGKAECVWFVGTDNNGKTNKFELFPEQEPGLLGQVLFNGHLITKTMAVISDLPTDVLATNNYILRKWDIENEKPLGDSFTAKNIWQYDNPENSPNDLFNPQKIVLDQTRDLLPIGTLVDIWEFEINRTSEERLTRSFFSKRPDIKSESLWGFSAGVRFGDLFTAREEINDPQDNTAISASEINVSDVRLFEKTVWGMNQFEDRLILSDDGGEVEDTDGVVQREPSGEPINNDIVADIDPSLPALKVIKQTKSLVGDINGDGVVDDDDLQIFLCAFGKTIFDDGYNPNADFNQDGRVDIRDLAIFGQQFDLNVEKVPDRPVFLWHRQNHKNMLMRSKIGMPDDTDAVEFPPYDFLLSAPVDSFDDTYVKVIKRGVFTTGPFAGAPFIVVKGMRWEDLPAEGVLRILTGAFRNSIWRYFFKAGWANWDDGCVTLIARDEVFPFDEDFPIGEGMTACTVVGSAASVCDNTDGTCPPAAATDATGEEPAATDVEAPEVPANTTVVELLRQDFTAPVVRLQFSVNNTTGAESVQLQFKIGILDMSVPYECDVSNPEDDLVRGLAPGFTVSKVFIQSGFIEDGIGADVESDPSGFRVYRGGELDVPVDGQTEKWNDFEIMLRDGQVWIWWNGLQITPDTVASASLSTPVTVSSPYFPINPQVDMGKFAIRMFPGAVIRQVELRDQIVAFNEFTNSQLELIN